MNIIYIDLTSFLIIGCQTNSLFFSLLFPFFHFSFFLYRFEKVRPLLCSPHRDEAEAINFNFSRGRNWKLRSELSKLWSFISLLSGVTVTSWGHCWPLHIEAKKRRLVLCSETAGRESRHWRCRDLYVIYIQIRLLITLAMLIQGPFSVSNPWIAPL